MVLVFVSLESAEIARKIAKTILTDKLGFTAKILPEVTSYRSNENDEIVERKETLLLISTKSVLYSSIEDKISEIVNHRKSLIYSVPISQMSQAFFEHVQHDTLINA